MNIYINLSKIVIKSISNVRGVSDCLITTIIVVGKVWLDLFLDLFFISFHVFFKSLKLFWKCLVKQNCLLFFNSVNKIFLYCLYLMWVSFFTRVFQSKKLWRELVLNINRFFNFESFNFNLFLEIFFRGTYESSKDSNFRFDVRKRLSQNFNQCLSYLLDVWWEE